jgi:hypothetical protein
VAGDEFEAFVKANPRDRDVDDQDNETHNSSQYATATPKMFKVNSMAMN